MRNQNIRNDQVRRADLDGAGQNPIEAKPTAIRRHRSRRFRRLIRRRRYCRKNTRFQCLAEPRTAPPANPGLQTGHEQSASHPSLSASVPAQMLPQKHMHLHKALQLLISPAFQPPRPISTSSCRLHDQIIRQVKSVSADAITATANIYLKYAWRCPTALTAPCA